MALAVFLATLGFSTIQSSCGFFWGFNEGVPNKFLEKVPQSNTKNQ